MKTINPKSGELDKILDALPSNTPIVMLNLLKFKDQAEYPGDMISCSGREAYETYSKTALEMVLKMGGKPIWYGTVEGSLIAPPDEKWDEVLLVRYPSKEAFAQMLADPVYQRSTLHRTAALDDSRLIATVAFSPKT